MDIRNYNINSSSPVNFLVFEPGLVSAEPDGRQQVDGTSFNDNFTLGRPVFITNLPDILKRVEK